MHCSTQSQRPSHALWYTVPASQPCTVVHSPSVPAMHCSTQSQRPSHALWYTVPAMHCGTQSQPCTVVHSPSVPAMKFVAVTVIMATPLKSLLWPHTLPHPLFDNSLRCAVFPEQERTLVDGIRIYTYLCVPSLTP